MRIGSGIGGLGRLARGGLVTLMAWLGASNASASTLDVTGYTLGEQVKIAAGATTGSVYTAELQVALDGQSGFSYCVDLGQSIGLGATSGWDVLSPEASSGVIRAAWLVDRFGGDLGTLAAPGGDVPITRSMSITALQLAVWETLADDPTYDLFGGSFALAQGGASANAVLLANSFLGELADADLTGFVTNASWAVNSRRQDQLVFTNPIPEPSSVLLFGFGAALVAIAVRREVA